MDRCAAFNASIYLPIDFQSSARYDMPQNQTEWYFATKKKRTWKSVKFGNKREMYRWCRMVLPLPYVCRVDRWEHALMHKCAGPYICLPKKFSRREIRGWRGFNLILTLCALANDIVCSPSYLERIIKVTHKFRNKYPPIRLISCYEFLIDVLPSLCHRIHITKLKFMHAMTAMM